MKYLIFKKKVTFNFIYFKEIEIECKGEGTKADPVIIEPSELIPNDFYVRNSDLFTHIKNFNNFAISLSSCQNVTVKNCQTKYLSIVNCSDISIDNLSVLKKFKLWSSQNVLMEDSNINKLKLYHANYNLAKNCTINRIMQKESKENTFESIRTQNNQSVKLTTSHFTNILNKLKLKPLIFLIFLTIITIIILVTLLKLIISPYIIVITFFILIFIYYFPEFLAKKIKKRRSIIN